MTDQEGRGVRLACVRIANEYAMDSRHLIALAMMFESYIVDGIYEEPDGGAEEDVGPVAVPDAESAPGVIRLRRPAAGAA